MGEEPKPRLFPNRWADAVGPEGPGPSQDGCACFRQYGYGPQPAVRFHPERQDTDAPGWRRLLALIDEAAADGREVFKPLAELTAEERRQIVTLPPAIAGLTAVRHLVLYGSNLVRIPPEIGAMENLEEFSPYTSYRLHWYPYEITRCRKLVRSTVSTRALYGNVKLRPHFPRLQDPHPGTPGGADPARLDPAVRGAETVRSCSVCAGPVPASGPHQVWISLRVATDVLPLLVNACSPDCVAALPAPSARHIPAPHRGGPDVVQPPTAH